MVKIYKCHKSGSMAEVDNQVSGTGQYCVAAILQIIYFKIILLYVMLLYRNSEVYLVCEER